MRFIHQVIDDLRGLPDDDVSPMSAALEELLGGERGSLPNLADRFTQAGLVMSWPHGSATGQTSPSARRI